MKKNQFLDDHMDFALENKNSKKNSNQIKKRPNN